MKDERPTLKLWTRTLPKLRLIYALTGESMVAIIDRLADQELERLQKERETAKDNEQKPLLTRNRPRFDTEPAAC